MARPLSILPSNIPVIDVNNNFTPAWYIFMQNLWLRVGGSVSQSNDDLIIGQLDDAGIEEIKSDLYAIKDEINSAPAFQQGYDYNPAEVAITGGAISGVSVTGASISSSPISGSSGSFTTLSASGDVSLSKTMTPFGTTGAQTINNSMGRVNFAAAATTLVVTNSLCSVNSIIMCSIGTADATMKSVVVAANAGSFTITANAPATAETRVNFLLLN